MCVSRKFRQYFVCASAAQASPINVLLQMTAGVVPVHTKARTLEMDLCESPRGSVVAAADSLCDELSVTLKAWDVQRGGLTKMRGADSAAYGQVARGRRAALICLLAHSGGVIQRLWASFLGDHARLLLLTALYWSRSGDMDAAEMLMLVVAQPELCQRRTQKELVMRQTVSCFLRVFSAPSRWRRMWLRRWRRPSASMRCSTRI